MWQQIKTNPTVREEVERETTNIKKKKKIVFCFCIKHPRNWLFRIAHEDGDYYADGDYAGGEGEAGGVGVGGAHDDDDCDGCTAAMTPVVDIVGSNVYSGDRDDDYCTMDCIQFGRGYCMSHQALYPMRPSNLLRPNHV